MSASELVHTAQISMYVLGVLAESIPEVLLPVVRLLIMQACVYTLCLMRILTHIFHTHILALTHTLAYSLTHSLAHSLTDSLTHPLTHSLTHSLAHSLTHSLSLSLTHAFAHSLTHAFTRSLTHPHSRLRTSMTPSRASFKTLTPLFVLPH